MAQEKQDVETLKRRGRRRLVGAVALVLAAVIVLPMVFDPEPRGTAPSVNVRIPGENETPFAPKPPPKKAAPSLPKETSPATPTEPAATPKSPAAPQKEEYVVQVGAFSNPQGAIAKLRSAKVPHYTEAIRDTRTGNLTRVQAGPFATREAAEKAFQQLKALGFEPGAVSTKSG